MPMGIVSNDDFEKELNNSSSNTNKKNTDLNKNTEEKLKDLGIVLPDIKDTKEKGRGKGNVEVPNGLRQLIGVESVTDGRESALELGRNFGISASSVSAYTNGATSTKSYNETPNKDIVISAKERISKKARKKLILALSKITDEKLDVAKVKDLAGVAKDMSAIVKNMEEDTAKSKDGGTTLNQPQFIFYSPRINKVEDYETITVKE